MPGPSRWTAMILPFLFSSCTINLCTIALAGSQCIAGLGLCSVALFVGSQSFLCSIQGIFSLKAHIGMFSRRWQPSKSHWYSFQPPSMRRLQRTESDWQAVVRELSLFRRFARPQLSTLISLDHSKAERMRSCFQRYALGTYHIFSFKRLERLTEVGWLTCLPSMIGYPYYVLI